MINRACLFAIAAISLLLVSASHAKADDCAGDDCLNLAALGERDGVNWPILIANANTFFGTSVNVFLSDSKYRSKGKWEPYIFPYFQPKQPGMSKGEIHIPYSYFARVSIGDSALKNYVWYYIVGHEAGHAYQYRIGLIDAISGPFDSRIAGELHADFLGGFFIARHFGLSQGSIDQLFATIESLPVGEATAADFHGTQLQRLYATSRGVMFAVRKQDSTLVEASGCGIDVVISMLTSAKESC